MLLASLLLASTVAAAPAAEPWDGSLRYRVGDDRSWSSTKLDESQWTAGTFDKLPRDAKDAVWVRFDIDLREFKVAAGHPFGIYVGGMFSYELFWDGEKIGAGGVVGRSKAAETAGPIEAHFQVPDRLIAPGIHTVALRTSAFHRGFSPLYGYWGVMFGNYDRIVATRTRSAYIALAAMSGIVLTAVFAFAMFWLARQDRSFLLLGALCIAAAALLIAEAWRPLFGYTYDWQIVRLRCVVAFSWLTGVLLVALVIRRFPSRYGHAVLGATAGIAAILPLFPRGWDPKSLLVFVFCVVVAVSWTIWAAVKRMHGSVLALIGVGGAAAALFADPYRWIDNSLYFSLNFLFVCLLCSHALEVRREQHERARLKLEMLRRQLQPHFLMNTLTALSEWIEEEPRTAVRMIDALAEELRILAEMSASKLVSAEDELRLCRSHLQNMSLRKDVAYELEVDGVDDALRVPPAVFHTLVENAVTHGASAERVTLRLSARTEGARVHYVFEAPAGTESENAAGTGTRYIEARLREAWGNAWSFRQGRAGALWRAEIEVPA